MIPLVTREVSRGVDRSAVEQYGIESVLLMENAGRGAADLAMGRFDATHAVIVGGVGQNGGDGWVVARHLHLRGFSPKAVLVGKPDDVGGDAATNLAILTRLGIPLEVVDPQTAPTNARERITKACAGASMVVDGLFGTGLSRPLDGTYAAAVEAVNRCGRPVLSLDIPSGVDADTGAILGQAIRATTTATFALHKRGLHQEPGAVLAGEVRLVSIGAPAFPPDDSAKRFDPTDVARFLTPRSPDTHKGGAGRVVVIGGSPGVPARRC